MYNTYSNVLVFRCDCTTEHPNHSVPADDDGILLFYLNNVEFDITTPRCSCICSTIMFW